jgi:hypothetical protein
VQCQEHLYCCCQQPLLAVAALRQSHSVLLLVVSSKQEMMALYELQNMHRACRRPEATSWQAVHR